MAMRPKTGSKMPRTIIMRRLGIARAARRGKSVAGPWCVLRQAQDEAPSSWHFENAILDLPHPELVEDARRPRSAPTGWLIARACDRLSHRTNRRGGIADAVDGPCRSLLDRAPRADRGAVPVRARRAAWRARISRRFLAAERHRSRLAHFRVSPRRFRALVGTAAGG